MRVKNFLVEAIVVAFMWVSSQDREHNRTGIKIARRPKKVRKQEWEERRPQL
jgi:hypothetical protein